MVLPSWTLKTVSFSNTLATTVGCIIIRCTKVWRYSSDSASTSSAPSSGNRSTFLLWNFFLCYTMNDGIYVCRIKTKNTLLIHLLNFLWIPLLVWMRFEIVINDAVEWRVFDCCTYFFSTLYALSFLTVYQFS